MSCIASALYNSDKNLKSTMREIGIEGMKDRWHYFSWV